jgi:hypothetical protein
VRVEQGIVIGVGLRDILARLCDSFIIIIYFLELACKISWRGSAAQKRMISSFFCCREE